MRSLFNDKTVKSQKKTVQDLKDFNTKSLPTQVKKKEHLVSMVPAFRKAYHLMG